MTTESAECNLSEYSPFRLAIVTAPCSRQEIVANSIASPFSSLTFPESVKDCAFNSSAIESSKSVNICLEPFIVNNKRRKARFIVHNAHSLLFTCTSSFPPKPRSQSVDPSYANSEPPICAHLLTSKTENEVSIGIFAEGKSYIQKTNMPTSHFVSISDAFPECYGVRM